MDISRAVDEFVSLGSRLFKQIKTEGQSLSQLELHILLVQLQVLQTEATYLKGQQPHGLMAPPSDAVRISHVLHHSLDLYKDRTSLLEVAIDFIRAGLEMQDTVVVLATKAVREAIAGRLEPGEFAEKTLLFFDAEDWLRRFIVNDWPDESRFMYAMNIGLTLPKYAVFASSKR